MNIEREHCIVRILNSAVNLYGAVTVGEAIELYNHYAATKAAPLADALSESEIDEILAKDEPDEDDRWFDCATAFGIRYVVNFTFVDQSDGEELRLNDLEEFINDLVVHELAILPESEFLLRENFFVMTVSSSANRLEKFLHKEYTVSKKEAADGVNYMLDGLRYEPYLEMAVYNLVCKLGLEIGDSDEFEELVDLVSPVARTYRSWTLRGHNSHELISDGLMSEEDFVGDLDDVYLDLTSEGDTSEENADGDMSEANADGDEGMDDAENDGVEDKSTMRDYLPFSTDDLKKMLPPAAYSGHIDFKFVKNRAKCEKVLLDYQLVRELTKAFVRDVVIHECTKAERTAAAKRLGFDLSRPGLLTATFNMIVGDFASMMDDQCGEPAIKRVLARKDTLSERERLAAAYYENYRYAWLVVEAIKSGVGVKCRDLISGQELFLMECSFSRVAVKGMTVGAGIAPMGDVYLALGVIHPAMFEPTEAVHRMVRNKLGLPLNGPLALSFADQARFAAETIARVNSTGRFSSVCYG